MVPVVLGAVLAGLAAAGMMSWIGRTVGPAEPDEPIEWNAVQAVPTRAPDAADIAWERRAQRGDSLSLGAPGEVIPAAAGAASPPPTSPSRGEAIYVIDGDTFTMGAERIRIAGIDAPETHPPRCMEEARLGLAATQKLRDVLSSGTVTLSGTIHDKYGREVREVRVNGQDVGEAMIGAGLARSYNGKLRQGWC